MSQTVMLLAMSWAFVPGLSGCASVKAAGSEKQHVHQATHDKSTDKKLARIAIDLLDPNGEKFDPEKGKAYLEYSLKHGTLKTLDVPASVLLELLRSEKVATEKSRNLEQQLEIMKEIDLTKGEEL